LGIATKFAQLIAVSGAVAAGVLVYFLVTYFLKLEEFQMVLDLVKKKIGHKGKAGTLH
jgi:putative peptidoglycan lipid II flippase